MDPDATLARMRHLTERADSEQLTLEEGFELAELVSGIDAWLSRGGFLPGAWSKR